jgi:hypothetical protein
MPSWLKLLFSAGRLAYEVVQEVRHEQKVKKREEREAAARIEGKIATKARACAGHEHEERCK